MSRIHGRDGRLYASVTSGGTAEPIAFLKDYSIDFTVDREEVTAFEDSNKTYLAGLPDASGNYSGYYDTDTAQMYTAAVDGDARAFYLYPDTNDTGEYFFGTATFDFGVTGSVSSAVEVSGSWSAATLVTKVAS